MVKKCYDFECTYFMDDPLGLMNSNEGKCSLGIRSVYTVPDSFKSGLFSYRISLLLTLRR